MEQSKSKHSLWTWSGIALGVVCFLYLAGYVVELETGWEYRLWVDVLGQAVLLLGIPLWLVWGAVKLMRGKGVQGVVVILVTILLVILLLLWGVFVFFMMVFGAREEHRLQGNYLAVDVGGWPGETEYVIYEKKGIFFRQTCDGLEAEWQYLTTKYGERFERGMVTDEMQVYLRGARYEGEEAWFSESHPGLPVYVWIESQGLEDDYLSAVWLYIFYQTYEEKDISTEYATMKGIPRLLLKEDEIGQFCHDVKILLTEAEKETLFQDYDYSGILVYRVVLKDEQYYYGGSFPFGSFSSSSGWEEGYYLDEDFLREQAEQSIRQVKSIQDAEATVAEWEAEQEGTENNPDGGEQKDTESVYHREAEEIYRHQIEPKGVCTGFNLCYSAKGVPYYDLGADGTYAYTLVYDRQSANEQCHLYVFYRSPREESGEGYVSYTGTGTEIADIYAYVIETGEIIASGRHAWADVGTEEYRKATGE